VLQSAANLNFEYAYYYVDIFSVGSRKYGLLPIYNNSQHACTIGP
jgi:hypothetical protein